MRRDLESLVSELKFTQLTKFTKLTNWPIIGAYKPQSLNDITFTSKIRNILTFYRSSHDNILLVVDFNMTPNNPKLDGLIGYHNLCNLISEPAFSKSIDSICTDNFLINIETRFMRTLTSEIGILRIS